MSKPHGHWGKFMSALDDMEQNRECSQWALHGAVTEMLREAERFYVPDGNNIIEGKLVDQEMQERLRLPFDVVAVLTECPINDGAPGEMVWTISIGIDTQGKANAAHRWINPSMRGWAVFSICYDPRFKMWAPMPAGVFYEHQELGYTIYRLREDRPIPACGENIIKEFKPDVTTLQNLCLMLSLDNVRTARSEPPANLNKSRRLRGRPPFHSYNILVVNGERWDGERRGNSEGYRSHMRRGHIRRLGERRVWVSSCFVRGRRDGFVDKISVVSPRHLGQ